MAERAYIIAHSKAHSKLAHGRSSLQHITQHGMSKRITMCDDKTTHPVILCIEQTSSKHIAYKGPGQIEHTLRQTSLVLAVCLEVAHGRASLQHSKSRKEQRHNNCGRSRNTKSNQIVREPNIRTQIMVKTKNTPLSYFMPHGSYCSSTHTAFSGALTHRTRFATDTPMLLCMPMPMPMCMPMSML